MKIDCMAMKGKSCNRFQFHFSVPDMNENKLHQCTASSEMSELFTVACTVWITSTVATQQFAVFHFLVYYKLGF